MNRFVTNTRIFFEGAYYSYRALFRWLQPATYLASKVLAPLTMMIFFVYIGAYASGSNSASFYVIGNSLIFAASSAIFGVCPSHSGAFVSSAQNHIVKGSPVTPDLHIFEIICMPVNEMAKFRQCISDRHRIINTNS